MTRMLRIASTGMWLVASAACSGGGGAAVDADVSPGADGFSFTDSTAAGSRDTGADADAAAEGSDRVSPSDGWVDTTGADAAAAVDTAALDTSEEPAAGDAGLPGDSGVDVAGTAGDTWVGDAAPDTTPPDVPSQVTPPEPDSVEPDPSEPDSVEPDPSEPDSVEPDPSEPDSVEPNPSEPDTAEPDPSEPDIVEPPGPDLVERVVIAGDSWSTGLVFPTIDSLAAHGYSSVAVTYELTAIAGSKASEWVANEDGKLDKLWLSLDSGPPAEILFMTIGGNDLNSKAADGFGQWPGFLQDAALDQIAADVAGIIDFALTGRPHLDFVIIGYDYLHYELLDTYIALPGFGTESYNQAFVDLEQRKLALCQARPRCHYAHNLGLLQWTYGDKPHFPFSNPLFEYPPGFVPKPGWAPAYVPFPGGTPIAPAPLDYMPDGIHPSLEGFRTIIDHTLDQGGANLVEKKGW